MRGPDGDLRNGIEVCISLKGRAVIRVQVTKLNQGMCMVWSPHRLDEIRIQRSTQETSTGTDTVRGGCSTVKTSVIWQR